MPIPTSQRFRLASGSEGDFSERVMVQAHRKAVYDIQMEADAYGTPGWKACRAVWQNVSNYRFPLALGVLNGPLINKESVADISDIDIEAAVGTIWPLFVQVYFPEPVE